MTLLKVGLVGCGKAKRAEDSQARSLYTGGLFRASLAEAEAVCGGHVYVVSAEHGLLPLDELVKPYDTTLRSFTPEQRKLWGETVAAQLLRMYPAGGLHLMVYAGRTYVDPIHEATRVEQFRHDWKLEAPLEGLGQGQRLAELKRRRDARAAEASTLRPGMMANVQELAGEELTRRRDEGPPQAAKGDST